MKEKQLENGPFCESFEWRKSGGKKIAPHLSEVFSRRRSTNLTIHMQRIHFSTGKTSKKHVFSHVLSNEIKNVQSQKKSWQRVCQTLCKTRCRRGSKWTSLAPAGEDSICLLLSFLFLRKNQDEMITRTNLRFEPSAWLSVRFSLSILMGLNKDRICAFYILVVWNLINRMVQLIWRHFVGFR